MRRMLAWLCAALTILALLPAVTAHAETPVVGRILATYLAAGGEAEVGVPLTSERKVTLSGVNGYSQVFAHPGEGGGVDYVAWNRLGGGMATSWLVPDPRLAKVSNERDALASSILQRGRVFRSARVTGASLSDKLHLAGILQGGVMIALNGDTDPNLPGVTRLRLKMTSTTYPATFVKTAADRAALGKALRAIAATEGPAWIHCTRGRDRTGWAVTVLLSILGADQDAILNEYLRTPSTSEAKYAAGLAAVRSRYGSAVERGVTGRGMYRYVRALGVTDAQIDALRAKLA